MDFLNCPRCSLGLRISGLALGRTCPRCRVKHGVLSYMTLATAAMPSASASADGAVTGAPDSRPRFMASRPGAGGRAPTPEPPAAGEQLASG